MDRRHFLKICAALIGGVFFAKILNMFSFGATKAGGLKEARFYKPADRLAG